jgi:acylphosphatase
MSDRRAYRIAGSVQGVGFRWWTRKIASAMGIRGTVRNAHDGSVEVEAEAPPDVLDRFEAALARGPTHARVRDLQRTEPGENSLPSGFEIIR